MRTIHRALVLALPALALGARQVSAQTPNVRIGGRIQAHFSTSDGDSTASYNPAAVVNSAFEIRRLRIQADVRIGENVNMVLQPSFEMGALRMRDAYLRVLLWQSPTSGIGLTMGQEKKPFNRYELTSSNTLPSIERGTRIRGFTAPAAQNNLLEENGYLAQDLGASADASLLGNRVAVKAGLYNGSGESAVDVNGGKTVVARVVGTVLRDAESRPRLRVGASLISRDRAVTTTAVSTAFAPDSSRRTGAWGVEAEWGDFRPGFHVIADLAGGTHLEDATFRFSTGRNVGNVRPNTPDSAFSTFRSLHVVASWRRQFDDPGGNRFIKVLEPALRVDLTDPNTARDDDAGLTVTPVLNVHFSQTTLMRAGVDLYRYTDASGATRAATAVRVAWQANF